MAVRHLVVCCDGTWNTADQDHDGVPTPTNVVRIFHALERDEEQLVYYHPGVGTGSGLMARFEGGAFGAGLSANIKSAYAWLAHHYHPGDQICLFGFSRGAYTVRSLAGMLSACGLPPGIGELSPAERWALVDELFETNYRPGVQAQGREAVPIAFLGVWDTVGSLGVPQTMALVRLIAEFEGQVPHFHDTTLSEHVRHARHALALDEMRGPFLPTLWSNLDEVGESRTARQVWFPGDHSDVGGGHAEHGLSDGPLRWMIDEAHECTGLRFRPRMLKQIRPDAGGVLHDSLSGVYHLIDPGPRAVPFLHPQKRHPDVHESVYERQLDPPITVGDYRPGRALDIGHRATCDVFAAKPWNWTGLYLRPGEYRFEATGEWVDADQVCDPDGSRAGVAHLLNPMHLVATATEWLQELLRSLTHDERAQMFGTPRKPNTEWMALLGVVTAHELGEDGVQNCYPVFRIGTGCTRTVRTAGYFYAFANDAWMSYPNNRGSVALTVTRLP